jgi:hypothetical protein
MGSGLSLTERAILLGRYIPMCKPCATYGIWITGTLSAFTRRVVLDPGTPPGAAVDTRLATPQARYGLSVPLMEVFCTLSIPSICRHVQCQLLRHELARFYHHRTRTCLPPRKLRRDIQ